MTQLGFRKLLIQFSLGILFAMPSLSAETERPPDIVVYLADDLSAADLPVHGGTNIDTPAIDQLAADGLTFDRAFVASPSCATSRAALLTGLMPARNGAEENHSYPREHILRLPQVLNKLGYQTAAFGKVAHLKSAPDYHFDTFDLNQNIPELRETVTDFLENRTDERPLALFVGVSDPHVPWPSESTVDPESSQKRIVRRTENVDQRTRRRADSFPRATYVECARYLGSETPSTCSKKLVPTC